MPEVWDLVSNAHHGDPGLARQGRRLVPAFFSRFFETELTTGADDLKLAFFALLAVLAVPGFALPLLLASASAPIPAESGFGTDSSGWGWSMIAHDQGPEALRLVSRPDKVFYLGFAMIASAIVSLITWNTLLVDRRDRIVLGPLPAAAVVLAKLAALLGYIGLVALAMHALASVAFGVALAANNTVVFALRGIAAHLIASVAASLFVMLAVVALQGLTLALLAPRWFARVSPALQLAVVCLVITGVLTLPALTQSVNGAVMTAGGPDAWLLATPPLWFLGLHERLLGTTNPTLLGLSHTAQVAIGLVSVTASGQADLYAGDSSTRSVRLSELFSGPDSVFTRDRDGTLRHGYSAHPWMAEDVKERGIDLLTPVYNMLDLTPQGRGNWYAKLTYPEGPHWPLR